MNCLYLRQYRQENYSEELWFWSAGIWGGSEIAIVTFVTTFLLRRYAAPEADWASLIFTFIGWFSGFVGSLFLPFDLSRSILKKQYDVSKGATPSATASSTHKNMTPKHFADAVLPNDAEVSAITQVWLFLFWFTFALSWLVIPSLQGFLAAEGFTWHRRLRSSIRSRSWQIGRTAMLCVSV